MAAPTALVTGASSGIGRELAKCHAVRGRNLVLTARRRDPMEALADDLRRRHGVDVTVLPIDLAERGAAAALCDELTARSLDIGCLINNAGFGGYGFFHERDVEADLAMIQVNVTALTELTRRLLPAMVERGAGQVMNVASVAGFIPGPLQAVYYATKAYVISFSEAIANELEGTGVTVTVLCPGPTATEFGKVADVEDVASFRGAASAEEVAAYGYRAMERGRLIAIPGFSNPLIVHVGLRFLPRGVVRRLSRKRMQKGD